MLGRTPFVIILDDLQGADAVTLVTLRFLVRARRHLECGRLADAAGEAETAQRIAGELGLGINSRLGLIRIMLTETPAAAS